MSKLLLAKTDGGSNYPPYFNFSQTGPCQVTLITRARAQPNQITRDMRCGDSETFVLDMDDVVKLAHELNQVIARFTSSA